MLCSQCTTLFGSGFLDELESLRAQGPNSSKQFPFHDNYHALRQSSDNGCEFCRLVCVPPPPGYTELEYYTNMFGDFESPESLVRADIRVFRGAELKVYRGFPPNISGGGGPWMPLIQIATREDDPAAAVCPFRLINPDISSEATLALARHWIKTCLSTHSNCPNDLSTLPCRVIDVGNDYKAPFLHISNGERERWVTLSHCWGTNPMITTKTDTIDNRRRGIPMYKLPQTFKDAILITRKLGFQYLWVDSLCIIQDSATDWQIESAKMSSIYRDAVLNISADASNSGTEGIFRSANNGRPHFESVRISCDSKKRGIEGNLYFLRKDAIYGPNGKHSVLNERAWVLQETTLLPRSLVFANDQLYYRCVSTSEVREAEISCCEITPFRINEIKPDEYPLNNLLRSIHRIPYKKLPSLIERNAYFLKSLDFEIIIWWYWKLNDYTSRKMTFRKDTFPAIGGLAKEFALRTGYNYVAGLWAEDILRGLLWTNQMGSVDPQHSPSWSWAGVVPDHMEVKAGVVLSQTEGNTYDNLNLAWKPHYKECSDASLVSYHIENVNDDPFGSVVSGSIEIQGHYQMNFDAFRKTRTFLFRASKSVYQTSEGWVPDKRRGAVNYPQEGAGPDEMPTWMMRFVTDGFLDPKAAFKDFEHRRIVLLRIALWSDCARPNFPTEHALILEPTSPTADTFRRIGVTQTKFVPFGSGGLVGTQPEPSCWSGDMKIFKII